jgi:DNA-binding MarR family transcriptional regulator
MNERVPGYLTVAVLGAFHAIEEQLEGGLEPLGLSLAKLNVLSQLVSAGAPLPLGTLADRCACVRSNITQLVDRLESDKLVLRADDPRDRRSVRAELTAEGRRRYDDAMRALDAAERGLLARIPEQHRDSFFQVLQVLRAV